MNQETSNYIMQRMSKYGVYDALITVLGSLLLG